MKIFLWDKRDSADSAVEHEPPRDPQRMKAFWEISKWAPDWPVDNPLWPVVLKETYAMYSEVREEDEETKRTKKNN